MSLLAERELVKSIAVIEKHQEPSSKNPRPAQNVLRDVSAVVFMIALLIDG